MGLLSNLFAPKEAIVHRSQICDTTIRGYLPPPEKQSRRPSDELIEIYQAPPIYEGNQVSGIGRMSAHYILSVAGTIIPRFVPNDLSMLKGDPSDPFVFDKDIDPERLMERDDNENVKRMQGWLDAQAPRETLSQRIDDPQKFRLQQNLLLVHMFKTALEHRIIGLIDTFPQSAPKARNQETSHKMIIKTQPYTKPTPEFV